VELISVRKINWDAKAKQFLKGNKSSGFHIFLMKNYFQMLGNNKTNSYIAFAYDQLSLSTAD